jgi:hypothetical protein
MVQGKWRDARRDARKLSWLRLGVSTFFDVNKLDCLFPKLSQVIGSSKNLRQTQKAARLLRSEVVGQQTFALELMWNVARQGSFRTAKSLLRHPMKLST